LMTKSRSSIISLVAAAFILVASFLAVRGFMNVSTPFVVVEGRSMIPTLYHGDMVLVYKPAPDEIREGMIIVYRSLEGRLVIHRVIKVNVLNGDYYYVTKGDNNLLPDNEMMPPLQPPYGVSYSRVLGVVVSVRIGGADVPIRIPYLGLLTVFVRG